MDHNEPETNSSAAALNQALVDDLKKRELIQTPRVEAAFRTVMRHWFLPERPLEEVYTDRALSAKQDQAGKWISSSSQPAIMAIMLEQLALEPGHKVLEIGTGPGYNAALMAHIVGDTGQVVTVEIDEDLADAAREHLAAAGYKQVKVICADGGYGFPEAAPFDRIILTVGAPDITPAWWDQMKPDGRLVLPLLLRGAMKSIAFVQDRDHLESISVADCGFIPLRGDFASAFPKRFELSPRPGFYVEPMEVLSIDSHEVYSLLAGPSRDWPAEMDVTAGDVLGGALWTWLALHEPQMANLVAEGDWADSPVMPALIGIDAKQRTAYTGVLIGQLGMAALVRPPGQSLPMVPMEKLFTPDSPMGVPFPLFVRQFGSDESITQRVLTLVRSWKDAGRPSSGSMLVRAYRKDIDYKLTEGEVMLEKPWTRLVVKWQPPA